jgi:hypothetical protein
MKGIVFTDVDGTLTPDRVKTYLDVEVIPYLRRLKAAGYAVVLVSGNSLPVLRGLSIYLGLGGIVVAENGAVAFIDAPYTTCAGCENVAEATALILDQLSDYVANSWQNRFRLCDKALKCKEGVSEEETLAKINEFLEVMGFKDVKAASSGYAIHLFPKDCGKDIGIAEVMRRLNISKDDTYCIGDAVTDVDMRNVCGTLVAVANADEELKKVADKVTPSPSSKGFIEFAQFLLEQK